MVTGARPSRNRGFLYSILNLSFVVRCSGVGTSATTIRSCPPARAMLVLVSVYCVVCKCVCESRVGPTVYRAIDGLLGGGPTCVSAWVLGGETIAGDPCMRIHSASITSSGSAQRANYVWYYINPTHTSTIVNGVSPDWTYRLIAIAAVVSLSPSPLAAACCRRRCMAVVWPTMRRVERGRSSGQRPSTQGAGGFVSRVAAPPDQRRRRWSCPLTVMCHGRRPSRAVIHSGCT